jgi:Bifunctional DNA primase/polymerase, N-terminal/AAA domain/Primase C terminal 1 (PriCT-1)
MTSLSEEERGRRFSEAAADYSRLSWALTPLNASREPRRRRWQTTKPDEPGQAAGKWSRWGRDSNMGVVLGPSGLAVVEYDAPEARETLLELLGGELPQVPTVDTSNRGVHLYFRDDGHPTVERDRLELRTGAHQCALPPSVHEETGREYRWLIEPWTVELVPVPDALLAYFLDGRENGRGESVAGEITEGGRHRTLLSIAGTMRRRGLTAEEICVALAAVNERRCRPQLPENEIAELARDVARRYQPEAPDPEQERIEQLAEALLEEAQEEKSRGSEEDPSRPRMDSRLIIPMSEFLASSGEEADWLVDHLIARYTMSLIAGLPKVGKSTFVFAAIAAITRIGEFLGLPVRDAGVLLITEEPPITVEEKVERFGIDESRIFVLPKRRTRGALKWKRIVAEAARFCDAHPEVELVVVDTIDKFADIDAKRSESDTGVIRETVEPLYDLLALGVAVVLVSHQRKEEGSFGLRVRGGTALTGSVDIIVEVERLAKSAKAPTGARVLKIVSRFGDAPEEIAVELEGDSWTASGSLRAAVRRWKRERILELLSTVPATLEEIHGRTGEELSQRSLRRRLDELVTDGLVELGGEGVKGDPYRWALSQAGREFVTDPESGVGTNRATPHGQAEECVTNAGGPTPRGADTNPDSGVTKSGATGFVPTERGPSPRNVDTNSEQAEER